MATRAVAALCALALSASALAADGDKDGQIPSTAGEADKLVAKIIAEVTQQGKIPPVYRARWALPIVSLIGSPKPSVRKVGADGLLRLIDAGAPFFASACAPALDPKCADEARVPLLALALFAEGTYRGLLSDGTLRDKFAAAARRVLSQPVSPPHFAHLAAVLAYTNQGRSVIGTSRSSLFAQRVLAHLAKIGATFPSLQKAKDCDLRRKTLAMLVDLGEKQTGQAIEDWYRIEPDPKLRRLVVDKALKWGKLPDWAARRKVILKLAASDWDKDIAEKARKMLANSK